MHSTTPNENIAATVVAAMTKEKVLSSIRLATGDQHFVFAIKTSNLEYVLRMTKEANKNYFISAIYWQEKLIPLGIPLAKFIRSDLNGEYSPFPALLMMRLPGDDLCNVYAGLTNLDKKNLAEEMIKIQSATKALPHGLGFGITSSYENTPEFKSWYDFLIQRLNLFRDIISKNGIFDAIEISKVISIANDIQEDLDTISPTPFLWDASEEKRGRISSAC